MGESKSGRCIAVLRTCRPGGGCLFAGWVNIINKSHFVPPLTCFERFCRRRRMHPRTRPYRLPRLSPRCPATGPRPPGQKKGVRSTAATIKKTSIVLGKNQSTFNRSNDQSTFNCENQSTFNRSHVLPTNQPTNLTNQPTNQPTDQPTHPRVNPQQHY